MPKYGISPEGVSALNQLAKDIGAINNEIEESGTLLTSKISSIGDRQGVYEEEIVEVVSAVNATQEKGRDSAELLSGKVSDMATNVESLLNAGFSE